MDLYAYMLSQSKDVGDYISKNYGDVPRMRGVRFMKLQGAEDYDEPTEQGRMYARHCGKDVIYIHTRCGGSNYDYFEAGKWEESNPTFIESCDDDFDCTYRDHYFEAVLGDEYDALIASILEGRKENEDGTEGEAE